MASRNARRTQARQRQSQAAKEEVQKALVPQRGQAVPALPIGGNGGVANRMNPNLNQPIPTMAEIGLSGLERHAGLIFEEFLPQLKGNKGVQIFKEMRDNDPVVGAVLFSIEKLLRQIKWTVEKQGDTPEHEQAAKFLEENMNDMSMTWPDVIAEAASMFPFGWAWLELCYKYRRGDNPQPNPDGSPGTPSKYSDGKIGWRKMPLRAQETLFRWEFDETGGIAGFTQRPAPDYLERTIPIERGLLFRTDVHKNNPEGRSILRNVYRPWFFKKRIEEIEAVGIERDLAGLPVMKIDPKYMEPDASPALKAMYEFYKKLVINVRRDKTEGLILPFLRDKDGNELISFELLSTGGTRAFPTDGVIARYERNMAMTALADWLMVGHGVTGSWALSSDKTNLFSVALGAWVDSIASTFNDYAVPRLFALNGGGPDPLPKIKPGDIETPDLTALGTFVAALASAGVPLFPNDNLVRALLKAAHLPEPSEEDLQAAAAAQEAMMQQQQPGGGPKSNGQTPEEKAELAELTGERTNGR